MFLDVKLLAHPVDAHPRFAKGLVRVLRDHPTIASWLVLMTPGSRSW